MPRATTVAATLLSLLPIALFLACRARRDRALWAVALDIPLALACDLGVVLTLSRFMPLERATFVSRAVWIVACGGVLLARRRRADGPAWPAALDRRTGLVAAAAGFACLVVSLSASRPYSIWDRKWHTPLVASLRGQTIPFENFATKGQALHYHFTGDVHAAMVQALSLDVMHSSLALSIGHDILFTLLGVTFALLVVGLGERRVAIPILGVLAVVLAGPYTIYRNPANPHTDGYSVLNYLSLSFRPHDAVAGVLYLGIVGALAARVLEENPRLRDTIPALLGSTAGLAISDETSLGLMGLALGLTWLAYPSILHPKRMHGFAVLVGMLVAFVVPNLVFAASIAPGAQRHTIALVPWRSPGCYTPSLPLTNPEGLGLLVVDLAPTVLILAGGLIVLWATRRARLKPLVAFACALFVLSFVGLTRIEVNHDPVESHRFMSGAMFLAPVLSLLFLMPRGDDALDPERESIRRYGIGMCVVGMLLGGASTVDWIASVLPKRGHRQNHFFTTEDLYALDCRKDLGATLGARAKPYYLSKNIWYAFAGCQPTFAPLRRENAQWVLTIGNPYFDKEAVRVIQKLAPGEPVPVICQRQPSPSTDPVCRAATQLGHCHDLGERLTECELSVDEATAIAR